MYIKFLASFIYCLNATNCLKGYLGLELTSKILALRFTYNLLLCSAGSHPSLLFENWGPLYFNATYIAVSPRAVPISTTTLSLTGIISYSQFPKIPADIGV